MARPEALGVYASLAILLAGVALAPTSPELHAALMTSAVLVFYSSVAAAYIASASPRSRARAPALLAIPLYAASPLHPLAYTLASLTSAYAVLLARRNAPRVAWRTLDSLLLVYASGASLGAYAYMGGVHGWLETYTLMLYAVPAAACIPINLHALIHTYKASPAWLQPLLTILFEAGVATRYMLGLLPPIQAAAAAYAAALAAATAKAATSRVFRAARGVARRAHLYTLWGEAYTAAVYAAYAALISTLTPLAETHMLAMGLIAAHVYLHAPLMLPVIVSMPASRIYTPLPQLLLAASLYTRLEPTLASLSAPLFATSIAVLAVHTVLPPRRRRGGRPARRY